MLICWVRRLLSAGSESICCFVSRRVVANVLPSVVHLVSAVTALSMLSIYYEIVNESATLSLIIVVVFYLNATTTTRLSNFGTLLDMNLLLFLYITISVRLGCIQLHLPAGLPDRESDDLIVDLFLHLLQIY